MYSLSIPKGADKAVVTTDDHPSMATTTASVAKNFLFACVCDKNTPYEITGTTHTMNSRVICTSLESPRANAIDTSYIQYARKLAATGSTLRPAPRPTADPFCRSRCRPT